MLLILLDSLTSIDSIIYSEKNCSHQHFICWWNIQLIESIYRFQTSIILVNTCHWCKGFIGSYYIRISLYAKGNLTPRYNKPSFSHGFSVILRLLWQSSAMGQLAMENGERWGKICRSKIRSWYLINCMINNNILDKIYQHQLSKYTHQKLLWKIE